jgi:hypothetical protein
LVLAQWVGRIGRLSRVFAPRVKCLTCLHFCSTRPPRTSRLLSCPRSVGGLRRANPALFFAKLRSDKNPAKHPWQQFACIVTAADMPILWRPHVRPCLLFADRTQEGNKQDATHANPCRARIARTASISVCETADCGTARNYDDALSVIVIRGAFTDHPLPTGGATEADWPARVIAAATKPDAFTSSTKSRTKAVPSKRPLSVPIACGMLPPMIA